MKKCVVRWTSITLLSVKDTTKKMNRQTTDWKKIFVEHTPGKRLISKIYKELLKHNSKKLPFKNGQRSGAKVAEAEDTDLRVSSYLRYSPDAGREHSTTKGTGGCPLPAQQCPGTVRGEPGREEKPRPEVAKGTLGKGRGGEWFSPWRGTLVCRSAGEGRDPRSENLLGEAPGIPHTLSPRQPPGPPTSAGAPLHLPKASTVWGPLCPLAPTPRAPLCLGTFSGDGREKPAEENASGFGRGAPGVTPAPPKPHL